MKKILYLCLSLNWLGCAALPALQLNEISDCQSLCLEARTNKGVNRPEFKNGETLLLEIKLNKTAYITVIYKDAGHDQFMLVQDLHIQKREQLGEWIQLPYPFQFEQGPYGHEEIYLFALPDRSMVCNTVPINIGDQQLIMRIKNPDTCLMAFRNHREGSQVRIPIITKP